MFSVILLCVTLTFVSAAPKEKDLVPITPKFINTVQEHIQKCEAETKPPAGSFKNMLKGYIENEASLKFMHCYLLAAGFLDKDGSFNIARVQSLVTKENHKEGIAKAFNDCNEAHSSKDQLERLRNLMGCYKDNSPVLFTL